MSADRYLAAHGKVNIFSAFPTLASGASIARGCPPPFGGAHLTPSLRSRWDNIGQKPEPTCLFFAKRNEHKYIISVLKEERNWAKTKVRKPLPSGWKRKTYCKTVVSQGKSKRTGIDPRPFAFIRRFQPLNSYKKRIRTPCLLQSSSDTFVLVTRTGESCW